MSANKKSTKAEKQIAVSFATLEVIEKDGLLGVTHSKVARKSGVSRAWIYEYIGQDKKAFIEFAAELIADHFARIEMNLPTSKNELEKKLSEGVRFLFDSTEKNPCIVKLYFRFRGTENPIGDVIRKYEKKWLSLAAKSASKYLGLSVEQAELLAEVALTLRLGFAHRLVTSNSPKETRKRAEEIFDFTHGLASLASSGLIK